MTHLHHHIHHRYNPQAPITGSNSDYTYRDVDPQSFAGGQDYPITPPASQPLKNVIGHAFEKSNASRALDPELVAQITAAVIEEIRSSGLATPSHAWPVSQQQHVPPSPMASSSPHGGPTPSYPEPTDVLTHPSLTRDPLSCDVRGIDDGPASRFNGNATMDIPHECASSRPDPPPRLATDDYTPIEKMWQRLFTLDGQPLPRLGEFLQGLALHLIEDYEPRKSLVISPAKMLRFYEEVRVLDETYPWQMIFRELSNANLSTIYRAMRCEHHLIQEHLAEPPATPALTPEGFETWMTAMILAYPDTEYERIAKAVLDMPISNAKDRKERFPKELPRRLFPTMENLQAQQRCAAALSSEGIDPLRRAPNFPPPPSKMPCATGAPNLERERSPYASKPDARSFIAEEDRVSLPIPIERERKPYSSVPGAGKTHDESHSNKTSMGARDTHRQRAQSTNKLPPSENYYRPRTYSQARPRSPNFSNFGTQSDPNIQDNPGSYYPLNLHRFENAPREYSKEGDDGISERHTSRGSATGGDISSDPQLRSSYDDDDRRELYGSSRFQGERYHDPRRR